MKNRLLFLLFGLLAFSTPTIGQFVPTKVEGTFSVQSWSGPSGPVVTNPEFPLGFSGSFSYVVNVPQLGEFSVDDVLPDTLVLNPAVFGTTTFSRTNVGLDLFFQDGLVKVAVLGGFRDGVNAWSWIGSIPNPAIPSDFFLLFGQPDSSFFYYVINDSSRGYSAVDLSTTLTQTALATAVPESASFGACAGLVVLALAFSRGRKTEREKD